MEHVEDQTLDVRPVQIRIGHDHDSAVAQIPERRVNLAVLETNDLLDR